MALKKKRTKKSPVIKPSPLSRKKIWVFRIISIIIIPLFLFGGLEACLRLFNVGYPTEAIIEHDIDGKSMYYHNPQFTWRFFSKEMARDFDGSLVFDKVKKPNTYRIFILGGSAAWGTPLPMYNFGRILEVMLSDMYPDIKFEVHNAAIAAINSHVVLEIAKDCAQYDPDLFIVYLGNNEVVGPFGPGTVLTRMTPSLPLIRANLAVKSTRTGQLIEQALQSIGPSSQTPRGWGGMAMFVEKQVRHNSAALESAYNNFEKNLQDICNVACRSGTPVIISNVAVNLKDNPPFASLHKESLTEAEKKTWEQLYQKGVYDEANDRAAQAIDSYLAAANIDDTFADLQFRLGRSYWQIGEYETARQHYQKALEYDTLRFRADRRINNIIRSVAGTREDEGIYFADSVLAFEANSPHQIPGQEQFYEHVHFNFNGNYILAKSIFTQIQKLLPALSQQHPDVLLSEEKCAERVAYTDFTRYEALSKIHKTMQDQPPFINQLNYEERMAEIAQQMDILAECKQPSRLKKIELQLENALQKTPDDWRLLLEQYIVLYGEEGGNDLQAEEVHLKKIIKQCPHSQAYLKLGINLHRQGRIHEAQKILYESLEIRPTAAEAHLELATIARNLGDYKSAIRHMKQVIELRPLGMITSYGFLAEMYAECGKTEKAIETMYQAIEIFPEKETVRARSYLSYLLYGQGEYKKAQDVMKSAKRVDQTSKEK